MEDPVNMDIDGSNGTVVPRFDMMPPPEGEHISKEALLSFAQTHAAAHGYALMTVKKGSTPTRSKIICTLSGRYKNTHKVTDETRSRNRRSKKCDCKMYIEGRLVDVGGYKMWRLNVMNGEHNHEGQDPLQIPQYRKRSARVMKIIRSEMEKGRNAKQALDELKRQIPGTMVTSRDIYNTYTKLRRAARDNPDSLDDFDDDAIGSPEQNDASGMYDFGLTNSHTNGQASALASRHANRTNGDPSRLPPSPLEEPNPLEAMFYRAPDGSLLRTADLTETQRLQIEVQRLNREALRSKAEITQLKGMVRQLNEESRQNRGVQSDVRELKEMFDRYVLGVPPPT
ncbi:hypothetical protein K402DRAFT_70933 [Aulographum hederae CBS 113979]|uniref:FAR1 domain-containing protein n=1 Tax=Aulographum hederae CBS 113979 TaxID=1176131 RepID=A0A6G1HFJ3_9PEZI|nr:hypothetical protein K402DRAFT_70933 [Aulographum hederae CBS 113979]